GGPAPPPPRARPRPPFGFSSFADGLDACRRILQRGARPAALRLYDETESARSFGASTNVLVVLDEGDDVIADATMAVVASECSGAGALEAGLVGQWLANRF